MRHPSTRPSAAVSSIEDRAYDPAAARAVTPGSSAEPSAGRLPVRPERCAPPSSGPVGWRPRPYRAVGSPAMGLDRAGVTFASLMTLGPQLAVDTARLAHEL